MSDNDRMAAEHVIRRVTCASCHGDVELECRGRTGFWGYEGWFEYLCPHCSKQNHARTTGTIVSARTVEQAPGAIARAS